jgi:hypothetical protein
MSSIKIYLHSPNMYFWRAQGLYPFYHIVLKSENAIANKNDTLYDYQQHTAQH